jgi:metallo-beta-lactamase family protein
MQIIPHGAAREVTGTCHELRFIGDDGKQRRVLLDCGLFQGKRVEAVQKNSQFTFDPVKDIDALVLSHAHMDHVGRVPLLWKKGYRGRVHCTYATKDLAHVMMQDGGYIQEKDEEFFRKHMPDSKLPEGPLYTQEDGNLCIELFDGKNYEDWFQVCPGLRAKFFDAGHVLGAAMVQLEVSEGGQKRIIGFSGDLGRSTLPIIRDPSAMPPVEALICEATYGNRLHGDLATAKEKMKEYILKTSKRGGKVLIPAFSLERTQQLVYDLHLLWDAKEIPPIPIIIDSPLASRVTDVFMKHPECYDKEMYEQFLQRGHNPFQFSLVRYTESVDESKALNGRPGPMIIMAGSGMCEAGRIRHHLKNELEDERNMVLAVGFMAQNTLGARLIDPDVREVKIFNETIRKRAEVQYIDAYSGHADSQDLDAYVGAIEGLKKIILVHGEPEQMDPFAGRLQAKGLEVFTPEREEVVTI